VRRVARASALGLLLASLAAAQQPNDDAAPAPPPPQAAINTGGVNIVATIEPAEVTIGDVLTLRVDVEVARTVAVAEPRFVAAPEPFELRQGFVLERESELEGGRVRRTFRARFLLFEVGGHSLPATEIVVRGPEGEQRLTTPAVGVTVRSVLPEGSEPELEGVRGVLPWTALLSWWLLVGMVALAAALVALQLWIRRRFPETEDRPTEPELPCDVRALRDLRSLVDGPLAAVGRHEEFFVSLSAIVRRYLGERFEFDALEMTTDELQSELDRRRLGAPLRSLARTVTRVADLAKFARLRPREEDRAEAVQSAFEMVEISRPRPDLAPAVAVSGGTA